MRISRLALAAIVGFGVSASSHTAPPGEVPPSATFSQDGGTLTWAPAAGATAYNVYRGSAPAAYDQICRVFHVASTSAPVPEEPSGPGSLHFYLISAVNTEGEGTLGSASGGAPRPNAAPCLDADADMVADNLDNCPGVANAGQADQDGNGAGDRCDPNTYDFEADAIGARPAEMLQLGPVGQSLTVKSLGGDHAISYDLSGVGTHDRFERLLAGMAHQNTTVYADFDAASSAVATLELWSEGAFGWNAGGGAILQITGSGGLTYYDRFGQSVPSIPGPAAPATGRMRLRLVKGAGNASTLHVDAWDGDSWTLDHANFPIADDHRYRGLGVVIADYFGGPRAIKRVTIVYEIPAPALTLRKDAAWSSDWKVFQRDATGRAAIPLRYYHRLDGPGRAQARVVLSANGSVLTGHDWTDHEIPLGAAPEGGAAGQLTVGDVPAGGNYDVELRLVRDSDGAVLGAATLVEIAVGDVFVAGGQSNMSGYSGGLVNAESPIDEVHLFHNDGTWKRAVEPMDDGTDQVDRVSSESPAHSLMLRFAKELHLATGVPIGILPGPLGGTNLHTQWQRDPNDHDNRATLYGSLLHRALLQGYGSPPVGFLWYQGESDAGRTVAQYRADLERLMAQYREDLAAPDLFFGIVQLATYSGSNYGTWIPIQEAQRQVVENDARSVLSAAVDLPRADGIHLNVDGYKAIGARLAAELREHLYGQPVDASARLVEIRPGSNSKKLDLVYDAPVTGGATALYSVTDGTGANALTGLAVSGNIVTLTAATQINGVALVTYGYSRTPSAAWVKDLSGVAVACFQNIASTP